MEATVERKYALTRIKAGDYLLPSNDGKTLWRLATYEDGPSHGLVVDWVDRDFWGLWKWHQPISEGSFVDIEDWNRWRFWEGSFTSRAQAIDAALRMT